MATFTPAGAKGANASFSVEYEGVYEALGMLKNLRQDLRRLANGDLRRESQQIGEAVRPFIEQLVASSPAPQADEVAKTVRTKSDRMVVLRIGAVQPTGLSGWRRGRAGNARWKGSIAWGVEHGPYPGSPNYYKVGRNNAGYAIGPNMGRIEQRIKPEYEKLLVHTLRRWGLI